MSAYTPTFYIADAEGPIAELNGWRATVRRVIVGTEGDDEDQAEVRVHLEAPNGGRWHATVCPDLDPAYGWDAVVGEVAAEKFDTEQLQGLLELAREALAAKRAE